MGMAIEVLPIGPVAVASRVWRHRGRRLFTAIVKASFVIQHDGPMSVVSPNPIVTEEKHYRGNPVASLVRASDFALLVPKPEMLIIGSAFSGPGQPTPQTTVRMVMQRDSTIVLNKRLEIMGDRRAKPGETPPPPKPFQQMPILYERAKGGIASRENPVGIGLATDPDGLLTFPNVNLPPQGGVAPAGFGPIPSAWPIRQKKRGSLSWTAANMSPDVDVPDDFDDAYFQTAPSDQQAAEIKGGDLVAIVNMHPELPMLRVHLPTIRGVALAQTARGDRLPLNLRIDTVYIEPEAMRAEIVFRGASVIEESALGDLRLAGALEEPGSPFVFPDLSTVSGLVRRAEGGEAAPSLETTAVIAEPAPNIDRTAAARALRDSVPPIPERVGRTGTMVMEPEPSPAPAPVFGKPPSAVQTSAHSDPRPFRPPANLVQEAAQPRHSSTAVIEPESAPQSLPFDKGHLKNRPVTAPSRDSTPWAIAQRPESPHMFMVDDTTMDAPAKLSIEPTTEPLRRSAPPPSPDVDSNAETPKRAPTPAPRSDIQEVALPEAPPRSETREGAHVEAAPIEPHLAAPPQPKPPSPSPRANLKQDLYKKLKR